MLPFLFGIPMYTLCAVAGMTAGIILFLRRVPERLQRRAVLLLCILAPGAVVGAKALYLIALPEGTPPPDSLLEGFVFHGGLIGGVLTGLFAAKLMRLPCLRLMDVAVPALCIGHGIGRIGCFCAGCCYGRILPSGIALPVQLMEAVGLFILGAWLMRKVHPAREDGDTAARYCLFYGIFRFFLEFLRGDEIRGAARGLSTGQWLSILLMIVGFFLFVRTSRVILTLHGLHLTIDNRLLGGLLPVRFDAWIERGADGRAKLRLRLAGKELSLNRSKRTQFHFLDALPDLKLHVRQLKANIRLGIPDDAALLAQTTGTVRALLNTAGAYLLAREERPPELLLRADADDKKAYLEAHVQAVLAFCTMDALRALVRTLRRQKRRNV